MRILITFFGIMNYGGIINNQEGLFAGLKDLGHEVHVRKLVWKTSVNVMKVGRQFKQLSGTMGMAYDQCLGWRWEKDKIFPYKGDYNLRRWKDFASKFDLIIWQIPVPSKNKDNFGNLDWLKLYDVDVPQVAYIHDGNFRDSYPWLSAVRHRLTGLVGVHPCAYHSLAGMDVPRVMAFSPQMKIAERQKLADESSVGRRGWFSLQTFKGWKHVDDLVRAVPHMTNDQPKILAGGGIHQYYMTSPTKTRQEYFCDEKRDPDMKPVWKGLRIWDVAIEAGMEWLNYIHNDERDSHLRQASFLIDPSWSKKYAKVGDHFNRVSMDAFISGCVPIARNLGVGHDETGIGEFFKPCENYVMIPYDATPREFAEIVDRVTHLPEKARLDMVAAGRESCVPHTDYLLTAQAFIDVAQGKSGGVYGKIEKGTLDEEIIQRGKRVIDTFFSGIKLTKGDGDVSEEEQD